MSSEELKPCSEPQAHPERCGCHPDAFQIARHSKRLVEQQRERIAALEAECERLRAGKQLLIGDLERRDATVEGLRAELADAKSARDAYGQNALDMQAQRDALAAELAAIKGQHAAEAGNNELLEALIYARRFLRKEAHDTDYIDAAIAKAKGENA